MKYYIKQSVFTISEKFSVVDEQGRDAFFVEGSFFKYPKEFKIYDHNGNPAAHIVKQPLRFMSHFDITTDKVKLTIRNNFTVFKRSISMVGGSWTLTGDIWGYNYGVIHGNTPILNIRKKWFSWGDSYELDIIDSDDAALCIAIVIVIDKLIEESQNN